jgi:hypothetical protein
MGRRDARVLPVEADVAQKECASDLVVGDVVAHEPAGIDVAQQHVAFVAAAGNFQFWAHPKKLDRPLTSSQAGSSDRRMHPLHRKADRQCLSPATALGIRHFQERMLYGLFVPDVNVG